ncbi:MAG: tyrosine-type recombinase/integrase [Pirellulales bacterium]
MPKRIKSLPEYRLHRATGKAIVTLNGRDFYLGPWKSKASLAEFDRLVGEWIASGRQLFRPASGPSCLTIIELVAQYWRFAQGYYLKEGKPTGHLPKVKTSLGVLKRLYGHTLAADFGPLALQAIQCRLAQDGLARTYVNDIVGEVKRVFRWGVAQQIVPVAVHQALTAVSGLKRGRTVAREPEPVGPVADSDVDAAMPYLSHVVADMIHFERLTGCRPTEVCLLRPCDLDRSGPVWAYRPHSHKTQHLGRARVVFIGPRAKEILLPYLLRAANAYCFSPAEAEADRKGQLRANRKTKVQPSQADRSKRKPRRKPGARYDHCSYNRAVARATELARRAQCGKDRTKCPRCRQQCEVTEIRFWHPNQLRHTTGTEVRKGYGLEGAQVVLGHSSAQVSEIYAERDQAKAAAIMGVIG